MARYGGPGRAKAVLFTRPSMLVGPAPPADTREEMVEPPGIAPGSGPLITSAFIAIVRANPDRPNIGEPGRLSKGAAFASSAAVPPFPVVGDRLRRRRGTSRRPAMVCRAVAGPAGGDLRRGAGRRPAVRRRRIDSDRSSGSTVLGRSGLRRSSRSGAARYRSFRQPDLRGLPGECLRLAPAAAPAAGSGDPLRPADGSAGSGARNPDRGRHGRAPPAVHGAPCRLRPGPRTPSVRSPSSGHLQ